jgi:hypothetical protein
LENALRSAAITSRGCPKSHAKQTTIRNSTKKMPSKKVPSKKVPSKKVPSKKAYFYE